MIAAVVALYGDGHGPFARVLVESLRRVGGARVVLVHADADVGWAAGRAQLVNAPVTVVEGERTARVARKLLAWTRGLDALPDGTDAAFLDADTVVERPLLEAFGGPFDVAHTWREGRRWPVNSGVVFVRVGPTVRAWMSDWAKLVEFVLADPALVKTAVDRWGAPDQAALMASLALRCGHEGLAVVRLDGTIWNQDWPDGPKARPAIWHMKGLLPVLLGKSTLPDDDPRTYAVARWRELYASQGSQGGLEDR